ncbi:MAG: PopZ family protein [Pseudomonadota bacterium]
MEEILASIRKIIESNDEQDGGSEASAPDAVNPGEASNDDEDPQAVMRAANQPDSPQTPIIRERVQRNAPRPPRMRPVASPAADTAVHVKSGSQTDQRLGAGVANEAGERPVSLAEVAAEAENASREQPDESTPPQSQSYEQANGTAGKPGPSPLSSLAVRGSNTIADHSASDVREIAGNNETTSGSEQALISAEAGAKVTASFGNLSHALVKGSDRSLDQITEDMLRPMLQQWLDDNLPTLVERLVREEIERVARGR